MGVQHSFNIKWESMFVFILPIVDTFGGWQKDSPEVISKLGRQVGSRSGQTGGKEDGTVRQQWRWWQFCWFEIM